MPSHPVPGCQHSSSLRASFSVIALVQEPEEAIREVDFAIKHLYKPREPAKLMGFLHGTFTTAKLTGEAGMLLHAVARTLPGTR